ncbi:cytochrome b/b6 domain-containing protein [Acidithiobacillus ferrianus]|uniref:Cytochrome b/b6 domain-containing protein n=2 Tax=Acidithiobacillus ferrianus TaxID=2678518 RepID=A0A845UI64_9PROT|nr:cytochrome b/b6 domain-containing protein [Acidithiobacillus ferrianus]NDU41398.1 cytochrome b/b6 domain-containing protein [Acidithiobacillus ferrianus]
MQKVAWDGGTRWLHVGLSTTLTFELFGGFLVSDPNTRLYFIIHEWGGLLATSILVVEWLWIYADGQSKILFPWNSEGMSLIKTDILALFKGKLPQAGRTVGLPGFWHGIGVLTMTGLAITGVLIFLVIPGGRGASSSSAGAADFTMLSGVHREVSYIAWIYWIGHVSASILHQTRGDPVFHAIFLGATKPRK